MKERAECFTSPKSLVTNPLEEAKKGVIKVPQKCQARSRVATTFEFPPSFLITNVTTNQSFLVQLLAVRSATFGVTHAILPQNQNVATASVALQRPTFALILAAKPSFSLANLVPKKSLRNGDDFDAKIGHDSGKIYGLSMIYGFYVVQAKFCRDEKRARQEIFENIPLVPPTPSQTRLVVLTLDRQRIFSCSAELKKST